MTAAQRAANVRCGAYRHAAGGTDVYSNHARYGARGNPMSKGMDRKKETKKKAAKSFDEKRAAKREKRQARGR